VAILAVYAAYGNKNVFSRLFMAPDRLVSAMQVFASEALGVASLSPPPLELEQLYRDETSASAPVLIITSAGADPSKELQELGAKVVGK
jgi:dynein heavy chain 2